jgi:protein TonB
LLSSLAPTYPQRARLANVQGVVVIDAFVDETGKVTDMKRISGSAMLVQAALDALRTWKYEPVRLKGEPIAMDTQVSVDFDLH